MLKANRDFFFQKLNEMFPDAVTELNYASPFQLLMAVTLSAQTTDKQVNKVTDTLFMKIHGPHDVVRMWHEELENSIKLIGLYKGKANNIWKTSNILIDEKYIERVKNTIQYEHAHTLYEQYGYYIPDTLKELEKLHGVGEKTAKVVAHSLYGAPYIAVDTHVHRVSNRIWLVKTNSPLQTSKVIEKKVWKDNIGSAHHTLVLFGRYHCKAQKPMCTQCPFTKFCKYYKKTINHSNH